MPVIVDNDRYGFVFVRTDDSGDWGRLQSIHIQTTKLGSQELRERIASLRKAGSITPRSKSSDVIAIFERPGRRPLLIRGAIPTSEMDSFLALVESLDA